MSGTDGTQKSLLRDAPVGAENKAPSRAAHSPTFFPWPARGRARSEMTEYSGLWTCRIFDPTYVIGDQTPQKEHELVRAEAVINFQTTSSSLEGTIEWPDVSGVS